MCAVWSPCLLLRGGGCLRVLSLSYRGMAPGDPSCPALCPATEPQREGSAPPSKWEVCNQNFACILLLTCCLGRKKFLYKEQKSDVRVSSEHRSRQNHTKPGLSGIPKNLSAGEVKGTSFMLKPHRAPACLPANSAGEAEAGKGHISAGFAWLNQHLRSHLSDPKAIVLPILC